MDGIQSAGVSFEITNKINLCNSEEEALRNQIENKGGISEQVAIDNLGC